MDLFDERTGGQKSHDGVPLRGSQSLSHIMPREIWLSRPGDLALRPGDLALSCNPSYLGGQSSGMV
jgi:hypothetical protein